MVDAVLDASALLAFLRGEPGSDRVAAVLDRACISSVNLAETYSKLIEYGKPLEAVIFHIRRLQIPIVSFDESQAEIAASFWKQSRAIGMSLGDRACLSLAMKLSVPALTTEQAWEKCELGARIVRIR